MPRTSDRLLCSKCIDTKLFKKWIQENRIQGKCDFDVSHMRSRTVFPINEFAIEVDKYFRETYQEGENIPSYCPEDEDRPHYEQLGDPYLKILEMSLGCDEEIALAIAEHLPDVSQRDIQQGAEPFYNSDINYEPIETAQKRRQEEQNDHWYEYRFTYQWQDFCKIVQYQTRFFNIKKPLDKLFGKPEEYEKGNIKPVYTLKVGQKIYRARQLTNNFTADRLEKKPHLELGAPPKEKTSAGRMNVEFIPVFYAAFSEDTALAEIRPNINDEVAIGEFTLQKEIKVFDFTVFDLKIGDEWNKAYEHTRYDFISQMQAEISKPIAPYEKQLEYIPTQIVAEYLKEVFGCEAIVYKSSTHKSDNKDNRNIVILNKPDVGFVGDASTCILSYSSHKVKTVSDVTYNVVEYKF